MSLRTPLGRVLGLGTAKEGTSHFWGQRVSALGLLILGLWFTGSMLAMPGFSHGDAVAFVAVPLNGVLLLLLTMTLAYHSTLGVQVVIEDYVHNHGLKLASLIIIRFAHVLFAAAAIYAILKIGLSA
jgi:succinate dehydrogenase / fumarate reductase membrane anchor subunit